VRISVWMSPLGLFAIGLACAGLYVFQARFYENASLLGQHANCEITAHLFSPGTELANCKIHLRD